MQEAARGEVMDSQEPERSTIESPVVARGIRHHGLRMVVVVATALLGDELSQALCLKSLGGTI